MSLTKVTYSMIQGTPINVQDYGAKGDGVTDDTAAFTSAITAAAAQQAPLFIPKTTSSYVIKSGLTFDVWKTYPTSDGARLDFTSLTSGQAMTFTSSSVASPTGANQNAYDIEIGGFSLTGDINQASTTGIYVVGVAGKAYVAQLLFSNIAIFGFGKNIEFGIQQWRIRFSHCDSLQPYGYHVYSPAGLSNSGEIEQFENCQFHGGSADVLNPIPSVSLDSGAFFFNNCSFLYTKLRVDGDNHTVCYGCNFEAPGYAGTGFRYGYCTGAAYLELKGCTIFPTNLSAYTQAVFYCDVTEGGGLAFDGTLLPMGEGETPETIDGVRTFVAGNGRVQLKGGHFYNSFGTRNFYPVAKSCNLIYNGDAELTNTNGWVTTAVSGAGALVASAAAKKTGNYGFQISTVNAFDVFEASETFTVTPGRAVFVSMWYQNTTAKPSRVRLEGYTANGTLTLYVQKILDGNGVWYSNVGTISRIMPPGTVTGKFIVQSYDQSVTYFDDVIINQI